MGSCTRLKYFAAQFLLIIRDVISRQTIVRPTTELCLNLITSGSDIDRVKRNARITPCKGEFPYVQNSSPAGLDQICSSNNRGTYQLANDIDHLKRGEKT